MPGFEIFGEEERKSVSDVLETGVLFRYGFDAARKNHWKAKEFECRFADYIKSKHCLLVSSGTSALSAALAACGVGFGDEIILPPFTFVATVEGVLMAGAVPVFAEIDETLCLDPNKLENFITDKTKGILPVHMCGSMAQIDKIKEVADRHNIMLMEDACQATGAHLGGKYAGTWGIVGCFSFDSVKTITCGEGGGLVTDNDEIYRRADAFHDHGHDHIGNDRGKEGHEILGVNMRISELNAAVGVAQLSKLDKILEIQRNNHKQISDVIKEFPEIKLRKIPDESGDSCTFISFILPAENIARKVAKELAESGVDGSFYWYDNNWHYIRNWNHIQNMQTAMTMPQTQLSNLRDYSNQELPQSDDIMSRTISMLIKLSWTVEDLDKRCENIRKVLKGNLQ
ncbi:MAG: DegT/DnrJ/EryC1/StrS family aminotransferase [Candidatus Kapabacteria bacterium]|nr:DegT/DnrJ/EryC1/StrS family aminotransferase [Ignavibacteriota bacterium]MCW5886136.1 DegT/DnrJ/EryC1/StrS family aminotransferase [Candidatus Kapabacteria bacterium]